jgi:hypothetical protein
MHILLCANSDREPLRLLWSFERVCFALRHLLGTQAGELLEVQDGRSKGPGIRERNSNVNAACINLHLMLSIAVTWSASSACRSPKLSARKVVPSRTGYL